LSVNDCTEPDIMSPPSPMSKAALIAELCYSASKGDVELVRRCLAKDLDVNCTDYDKRSALHIAASDGQMAVIEFLISAKANVNSKDRWGHAPLDEALQLTDVARRGAVEAVLRAAGAVASEPQSAPTSPEFTRMASPTIVAEGLENLQLGASSSAADEIETATLLCCAAGAGRTEYVQELHSRRADLSAADYDGRTALHVAASHGHVKLVEWLLESRADFNKRDCFSLTPLSEAMRLGHEQVAGLLVGVGAQGDGDRAEVLDIRMSANAGHWTIPASEVHLGSILSTTLKSIIYRATWRGTQVVAKTTSVLTSDAKAEVSVIETLATRKAKDADPEKVAAAQEIIHEIQLLSTMRHPDLVMFLGACFDHDTPFFLTEFMEGGDLERYYKAQKQKSGYPYRPSYEKTVRWSSSVARALCFLHGCTRPIIHRDLKPLNLLLNRSEDVKVTDFGISKLMAPKAWKSGDTDPKAAPYMSGGVGTWRYMAPEVVRYQQYTDRVDIYSFALIMWFMSTGRQPFVQEFGEDAGLVLQQYQKGGEPRPDLHTSAGGWAGPRLGSETTTYRKLIQDCWHETPAARPSAQDCTQRLAEICAQVDVGQLASFRGTLARLAGKKK